MRGQPAKKLWTFAPTQCNVIWQGANQQVHILAWILCHMNAVFLQITSRLSPLKINQSKKNIINHCTVFWCQKEHIWHKTDLISAHNYHSSAQIWRDPTFCIKETGLLAVVNHLLLALLRSWHDGPELFSRGAVVELHDVRFVKRGALDCNWSCAVVRQHRPHLLL